MKRLLFWARMLALAIPLVFIIAEFRVKPEIIKAADDVPDAIRVLGGNPTAPLTIAQAKDLWKDIDERVKKLEHSERRREFITGIFDTPFKAKTIIGCAAVAWLLQVLSFGWDEKQKKKGNTA